MLKYVDTKVVFAEIPDEITLAINISGCPCNCRGCHSSYLAGDIGELLCVSTLNQLIFDNKGVTCVAFMGGDANPFEVNVLAKAIKENTNSKVAWYSGRQELSEDIELKNFDYIKLGPYIEEFGPLNSKTTNQKMYKVVKQNGNYKLVDITNKFWK